MHSSRKVVYAGLATNLIITIAKLVVAIFSGSSAMLAEFFHSAVDTGNSVLLIYVMKHSQRPAHRGHAFGHGKELYFWSFVVHHLFVEVARLSRRPDAVGILRF